MNEDSGKWGYRYCGKSRRRIYFEPGLLKLTLTDPFFIEWTTITGKRQKSGWLYNTGYQISEFRSTTRNEKFKFGLNRIKIEIKSPLEVIWLMIAMVFVMQVRENELIAINNFINRLSTVKNK
jgi:hypothetical protein